MLLCLTIGRRTISGLQVQLFPGGNHILTMQAHHGLQISDDIVPTVALQSCTYSLGNWYLDVIFMVTAISRQQLGTTCPSLCIHITMFSKARGYWKFCREYDGRSCHCVSEHFFPKGSYTRLQGHTYVIDRMHYKSLSMTVVDYGNALGAFPWLTSMEERIRCFDV